MAFVKVGEFWKGAAVGIGVSSVGAALTAAYLASITIDDGLEALIGVPIIAVLFVGVGALGGWRGRTWRWVLGMAVACAALIGAVVIIPTFWMLLVASHEKPSDFGISESGAWVIAGMVIVSTISTVGTIAGGVLACGAVGWASGGWFRQRRSGHLPPPPPPPLVT